MYIGLRMKNKKIQEALAEPGKGKCEFSNRRKNEIEELLVDLFF